MPQRYFLVGLTGQTGAGKTTVSRCFAERGFSVINADDIAHKVTERGSPCLQALRAEFGEKLFHADGSLDRKATAAWIFGNAQEKKRYESIIFPFITQEIQEKLQSNAEMGKCLLLLDAPTLFESGANRLCHRIVAVTAELAFRLERICKRDGISVEAAEQRAAAQHSEHFFREHADILIENNGSEEQLTGAAIQAIQALKLAAEQFFNSVK